MNENNAGAGSGMPDAGATSGNGGNGSADIERLINDAINKAVPGILKRALPAMIPQLIEAQLAAMAEKDPAPTSPTEGAAPANGIAGNNANLKAHEARLAQLEAKLKASEEARAAAEQNARTANLMANVEAAFSKGIGADNPALRHLVKSYAADKRFDFDENGQPGVRFKREWGDELVPLDKGFSELLSTELKPFVPARNGSAPPSHVQGRGQPYKPQQQQAQQPGRPFFMNEVISELGKDRPELAAAIDQSASR